MFGPEIVVASISARDTADKFGNPWQYNSRSDHHSKVACWAVLFDVILNCPKLLEHIESGSIGFGVNHEMLDFKNNKPKNLDLVICTPSGHWDRKSRKPFSFRTLGKKYGIVMPAAAEKLLSELPDFDETPVGSVRLALEAKACMTAHQKSKPRLHDELSSSHHTIHGASDAAIAAAFVMINNAEEFISSVTNRWPMDKLPAEVNRHKQPKDTLGIMGKLEQLPRRTREGEDGFDAFGIVVVDGRNDGSPFSVVEKTPAPMRTSNFHYDQLIHRIVSIYESRYA